MDFKKAGPEHEGLARPFSNRCACGGVDIHCHVVPQRFPALPSGFSSRGWPSTVADGDCHVTVMIDDKPYRRVNHACYVAEQRIAHMDSTGIAVQALSPMPELFGYWLETGAAATLTRHVNDVIEALVAEGHGRFTGLGGVPLADVDLAIAELQRLMATGHFRGVEIGSNINGAPIGDARFLPFFAEAERLGAAVFVHAVRPAGMERLVGPKQLQQVLGYPSEIGLALASLITGGVLARHPALKIAFSHGGGSFAALLPRLQQGYHVFPDLREQLAEPPTETARRVYVDSLVFDHAMLQRLLPVFGPDRIMLGTDYPFNFQERDPARQVREAFDDEAVRALLIERNARRFLGLEEPSATA
ncbi:amidohydrolase family protein [Allorhizobium undicola]|uniref:amidohydrolase family protein n=1 Tax=Allorhizobium undicola TaxID=78527 RepID=UPI0006840749|nr:amidohydrolase family protein [Allorhizobium undicola]